MALLSGAILVLPNWASKQPQSISTSTTGVFAFGIAGERGRYAMSREPGQSYSEYSYARYSLESPEHTMAVPEKATLGCKGQSGLPFGLQITVSSMGIRPFIRP